MRLEHPITTDELTKFFGEWGNIEDYWLGNPPGTNTFLSDNERWLPAEAVLRGMRQREFDRWTPEDSATEDLMRTGTSGGGLTGVEGVYHDVLAGVVDSGRRALDEQARLERAGRNRTKGRAQ